MLPVQLRILLVLGALFAANIVFRRIKKEKILFEDAIFWVVLSFLLLLLAIFPGIAISLSQLLGFVSPSNLVYLVVIVLLLWKAFSNSTEISQLKNKVNELAQEVALEKKNHENE